MKRLTCHKVGFTPRTPGRYGPRKSTSHVTRHSAGKNETHGHLGWRRKGISKGQHPLVTEALRKPGMGEDASTPWRTFMKMLHGERMKVPPVVSRDIRTFSAATYHCTRSSGQGNWRKKRHLKPFLFAGDMILTHRKSQGTHQKAPWDNKFSTIAEHKVITQKPDVFFIHQ